MIRTPLLSQIRNKIQQLHGIQFQEFVTTLFLAKYGHEKFYPPRKTKDLGCDGIIEHKETVVACYGPEKLDIKRFKNKVTGDYHQYYHFWANDYPRWKVVINHDLNPQYILIIKKLKSDSVIMGLEQVISMVENLPRNKIRQLAAGLNVDREFIRTDYVKEIIEDLISQGDGNQLSPGEKPVYILDKIALNFSSTDHDNLIEQYNQYFETGTMSLISRILKGYSDVEKVKVKNRILSDFSKLEGNFESQFYRIFENYSLRYNLDTDDDYAFYIKGLLLYFFEQCLIGKKY